MEKLKNSDGAKIENSFKDFNLINYENNIHQVKEEEEIKFNKMKHIKYLKYVLSSLKKHFSMESHKITILYFIVGGLIILKSFTEEEKEICINFVINNAVIDKNKNVIGFRGGNFTGWSFNSNIKEHNFEDIPHIAASFCSLAILKMCGIDTVDKIQILISELHKNNLVIFNSDSIIGEILKCQNSKGKICSQSFDSENDVRFFYCAMAIFKIFGKTSEEIKNLINFEMSKEFLYSIRNYEGGFSMVDEGESNAGVTYCAIASYKILDLEIPDEERLIFWLNNRNSTLGVNGRTNKIPDTCYSFWVMGSLCNLEQSNLFDRDHTINFILNCQTQMVS